MATATRTDPLIAALDLIEAKIRDWRALPTRNPSAFIAAKALRELRDIHEAVADGIAGRTHRKLQVVSDDKAALQQIAAICQRDVVAPKCGAKVCSRSHMQFTRRLNEIARIAGGDESRNSRGKTV